MFHLLPIRILLSFFAFVAACLVMMALTIGQISPGHESLVNLLLTIFRWSTHLSIVLAVLAFMLWRWVPLLQEATFPYLGGQWKGRVIYGPNKQQRDVTLDVKHTLLGLKLHLESDESTSRTLAVHAEKDPDFSKYQLYYVYRNERKPGVAGAGTVYRGLAVIRVEVDCSKLSLHGDYFTENQKSGTLTLDYTTPTPWWKIWR